MKMVIHGGIRYRPEDAQRLNLESPEAPKKAAPKARNKARRVASSATSGADAASAEVDAKDAADKK